MAIIIPVVSPVICVMTTVTILAKVATNTRHQIFEVNTLKKAFKILMIALIVTEVPMKRIGEMEKENMKAKARNMTSPIRVQF